MSLRKWSILTMVVVLLMAFAAVPVSAQEEAGFEVTSVTECRDGLVITFNGDVSADETMLVGWMYQNEVTGLAANGVALTDLPDYENAIVLPHVGLDVGEQSQYTMTLLTADTQTALMGMVMMTLLTEELPEDTMLEDMLGSVPLEMDQLIVEDCSVEGMDYTTSNAFMDEGEMEQMLNDLFVLFLGLMAETDMGME